MFEPAQFFLVARWLVSEHAPREAEAARVRAAYGRAYYALYLLVRTELERRHHIRPRWLQHGAVYTHLQSPRAGEQVRSLGRELQRLYTLRQKADYALELPPEWEARMEDEALAADIVAAATTWAARLPLLDFSSVVPLLDPRG
ncbi:MAG: hypothetical protein ACJ8J0_17590 [Longimicrobiaceae bacterium]